MSIDDCPDCRKLQSECEALERELKIARDGLLDVIRIGRRELDPRAPVPTYIPAAVPPARPQGPIIAYCAICDREHDVDRRESLCRP